MLIWKKEPRGINNRNPLNIRESKDDTTQWKGERATDDDKSFEEFEIYEHGFRASARILRSYNRRNINTIHKIIHTFAPTNENDTDHYIDKVSEWSCIDRNTVVDVNNSEQMAKILQSMARMEVGHMFDIYTVLSGVGRSNELAYKFIWY